MGGWGAAAGRGEPAWGTGRASAVPCHDREVPCMANWRVRATFARTFRLTRLMRLLGARIGTLLFWPPQTLRREQPWHRIV